MYKNIFFIIGTLGLLGIVTFFSGLILTKDKVEFGRLRYEAGLAAGKELYHEQEVVAMETASSGTIEFVMYCDLCDEVYENEGLHYPVCNASKAIEISEPNESEWYQVQATIHKDVPPGVYAIWSSPGTELKPFDITSLIPTWPDYIELEKDLVITRQIPNSYSWEGDEVVKAHNTTIYRKGTRIYFKGTDNDERK